MSKLRSLLVLLIRLKMVRKSVLTYYKNCVFFRSKINTKTPEDISTLTIWSNNSETHKVIDSILKTFSMS